MATLNINGLKSPTKWYRLTERSKKQHPSFRYLQETHLPFEDGHYVKVKGWKKFRSKWDQEASKCSYPYI